MTRIPSPSLATQPPTLAKDPANPPIVKKLAVATNRDGELIFFCLFDTGLSVWLPGPLPALEWKVEQGPDGESRLTLDEEDLSKLRRYWTLPAKRKFDPWMAAKSLAILGVFGLMAAIGYFQYRRDGRASLVLDARGIAHAWIGRVPWERESMV